MSEAIRAPEVSAAVSAIATNLDVRADLVARQRQLIAAADRGDRGRGPRHHHRGRARTPTYACCWSPTRQARVARRHAELGDQIDVHAVTDQVIRRDRDDSAVAEFHSAAPGVRVVDSTELSLDEVIDRICALVPVAAPGDARP